MALIGKIRKNFWIVLVLLGLALLAFILMEAVSASNRGGAGPKQVIGTVAGKDITAQEFGRMEAAFSGGSNDRLAARESAWNYLVSKKITDKQSEDLGIGIGNDEIMDLQFGPNYSPVILQNPSFVNPQTGQVNNQALLSLKQKFESGDYTENEANWWKSIKSGIITQKQSSKVNNLVSKAIFTPSFLLKEQSIADNQSIDFDFVKVGFDNVDDSAVTVTDSDIKNYISANASAYNNEFETRKVEYAVLNVVPSSQDSLELKESLVSLKEDLKTSTDDSLFVSSKEGFITGYLSASQVAPALKGQKLSKGSVYGPYLNGTNKAYQIAKVLETAVVPDSVKASHILIKPEGITLEQAETKIDSIKTLITNGKSFASAAEEFGQDATKTKGGDLGTFSADRMVKEFSDVCFAPNTKEGRVYKVKTRFGWHLVKVNKRKFNSRSPKYKTAVIPAAIVPSQGTQDAAYDEMNAIIAEAKNLEQLKTAANSKPNVRMQTTRNLKPNDYKVGRLNSGDETRNIVKWAYGANEGEVSSKIFTFTNPEGFYNSQYVVAGLSKINAVGLPSVDDVRANVTNLVKKQKKGEILSSKINGTDLAQIAADNSSEVTPVTGVRGSSFPPGLGYEPKVLASAKALTEGSVSAPIIGNNGVYVVKTNSKSSVEDVQNIGDARKTANQKSRGNVVNTLFGSLFETYKPEDNRSKFF